MAVGILTVVKVEPAVSVSPFRARRQLVAQHFLSFVQPSLLIRCS